MAYKTMLVLLAQTISLLLYAQKQDAIWPFGYDYLGTDLAEGINFDFSNDTLRVEYLQRNSFFANSSSALSDSSGKLLLDLLR